MSDQKPSLPVGEGDVPDKVLEELLAAFAGDDTPVPTGVSTPAPTLTTAEQRINLDDPAIDALLGIEPVGTAPADSTFSASAGDVVTSVTPVTPAGAAAAADARPDHMSAAPITDPSITEPSIDAVVLDLAAGLVTSPNATQHAAIVPPDPAPVRKPIQIDGSDDALIDAVYLDEEGADRLRGDSGRQTEASMERTTILIGDDELEGSSGGIPVATGPNSMDPRLRARRIAVKRAVGRRRLKWFVIGGAAVIVITAVLAVLGSSLFEVTTINPSGVSANTKDSYDAAVAQIEGHPILLVDTHKIESQLEKNPWISEARVSTDFPDRASIEIVERVPIATYQGADSRWRIIDVDGVVLTVIAGQPLEFMAISGPGAEAEAGGSAGNAFRHAAELVQALSPAARSRTEQVVVSDTGELSLQFADTTVVLGAPENLLDKLTWLEALLQDDRATNCTVINVTTRDPGCVQNS